MVHAGWGGIYLIKAIIQFPLESLASYNLRLCYKTTHLSINNILNIKKSLQIDTLLIDYDI